MNKSIKVVGAVIIVFLFVFAVFGKLSLSGEPKETFSDEPEVTSDDYLKAPDNYDIKLYVTDYVYDNGYQYKEVALTEELKKSIIEVMNKVKTNSTSDDTTYGKYKLQYGTEIIYFDLDNNGALYNNKSIYFSKEDKLKIANNEDHCSCCGTANCNINVCGC